MRLSGNRKKLQRVPKNVLLFERHINVDHNERKKIVGSGLLPKMGIL